MRTTIIILTISTLLINSCGFNINIEDEEGNSIIFKIEDIELTSSEIEKRKDSIIISEVNNFIDTNKSAIIINYKYLCDSNLIEPLRNYIVDHKDENIQIGIGKKDIQISPIPLVYKISEGPYAKYKIDNDNFGKLSSYIIDIELDGNFKIIDFKATLRFMQKDGNVERVSFKKEIYPSDNYLIEENIKKNRW